MAPPGPPRSRTGREDILSPQVDVPSPETRDRDHPDSWTLHAILGIKETQGATTEAIKNLTAAIERVATQLAKIDDLRVDLGKLDVKVVANSTEIGAVRGKLDKVYTWMIGAAAIVAFLAFATPVALRFLPVAPQPAVTPVVPVQPPVPPAPPAPPPKTP